MSLLEQLARIRETLSRPIPDPVLPKQVFLRCDCCHAQMRSEISFLCRSCIRRIGVVSPEGQRLLAVGMEQVDAMHDAAATARFLGRWN